MIGYVTLGTNNLDKAVTFYDQLLSSIGAGRFIETELFVAWAKSPGNPGFTITKPFNGARASVGNGTMIAFTMDSPEQVDAFYQKAIELGATDDGRPGPRGEMTGFYAGYFRDLDGNKINAFYYQPPKE
ncbi:VOC family protein [Thalassomonas haliotis]|uniref:VOC family protein n=2 Tax=Thalassomonas haliotis TaxID=485448 RepID=A0ABY7VL64_9GAMM|nr:VOC family protein [Thalassomonas haliotis]WDE14509.1 VOC family protein [Thalassomonas haliotis]